MRDVESAFYNFEQACYRIAERGLVEQAKAFIAMLHEQEKLEYEKKDLYPWRVRYQAFKEDQKNAQAVSEVFRLRDRLRALQEDAKKAHNAAAQAANSAPERERSDGTHHGVHRLRKHARKLQAELEEAEVMFHKVEDGEPVAVPEKSLARPTHPLLSRYGFRQRLRYFGSY